MKTRLFCEDVKQPLVISGWIFLILYCFYFLKHIPVVKELSLFLEILFIFFFIPTLLAAFKRLKGNAKNLLWIPGGFVLIFVLQTIIWNSILLPNIQSFIKMGTTDNMNQNFLQDMLAQSPVLYVLGIVLIGPILEELLYRLICFGSLYPKSPLVAHLVTALLFGFQHVADAVLWHGNVKQLINMGGYIIFSLILTFIYSKKKNIWICIGIHVLNNLLGVILLLGMKS